jgi:hypothetical protein
LAAGAFTAAGFFAATDLAAAVFVAGAALAAAGLGAAGFLTAVALDFAAGFGLEAAEAGFDAALDLDGALAMNSPTPRMCVRATPGPVPGARSIRHDNEV